MISIWSQRVHIGLGAALFFSASMGILSYTSTTKTAENVESRSRTRQNILVLGELLSLMKDIESSQRGYLLTQNSSYLEPYNSALKSISRTFNELETTLSKDPKKSPKVKSLGLLIQNKITELQETVSMTKVGRSNEAIKVVLTNRGQVAMNGIRRLTNELLSIEESDLKKKIFEVESSSVLSARIVALGSLFTFLLTALAMHLLNRDIKKRRHVEQRLKEANEEIARAARSEKDNQRRLFETVLEQLPAAVIIAEAPSGKLVFANNRIHEVWRHPLKESQNVGQYGEWIGFHPDGSRYEGKDWPLARALLNGETIRNEDTEIERGDGTRAILRLSAAPVRDRDGEMIAAVVICEDVTDRKQAETEHARLMVREQAAQAASQLKSEFLANMSHEIRTPINGVMGMTGLLLETTLSRDQKEYAENIRNSADGLLSLINDILDFSKVESGKLDLEEIHFELASVIQDLQRTLNFSAIRKGLQLRTENLEEMYLYLNGDPGRLRQILINLISNAIKFTSQGEVVLKFAKERLANGAWRLRFEVVDTGIGISESSLPRMFKVFSQGDGSTTRRFGGSGLGLSICKKLVELMKGKIGVESTLGQGSTFWFTIEVKAGVEQTKSKNEKAANTTVDESRFFISGRILVAEDNPINQKIALKMLERMGHRAHAVANGQEVLLALKQSRYDLILMDCQMPEMDGYETTSVIRKSDALESKAIPIIAMTANALKGDMDRCLAAGMNDYLPKPVNKELLAERIQNWLRCELTVSEPVLDSTALDSLRSLDVDNSGDGQSMIIELVDIFTKIAPKTIEAMRSAVKSQDFAAMKREAHTLKSSSANLGARRMSTLCKSIEQMRALNTEQASALIADLDTAYKAAKDALDKECAIESKTAA